MALKPRKMISRSPGRNARYSAVLPWTSIPTGATEPSTVNTWRTGTVPLPEDTATLDPSLDQAMFRRRPAPFARAPVNAWTLVPSLFATMIIGSWPPFTMSMVVVSRRKRTFVPSGESTGRRSPSVPVVNDVVVPVARSRAWMSWSDPP